MCDLPVWREQIFAWAPAIIVALGFRLFEQRALLRSKVGPLIGGSLLNCLLSCSYTVASCRVLRVPPSVGRCLVARFITLPMAVPLTVRERERAALSGWVRGVG
jgi:putative effector of murein hydrolase